MNVTAHISISRRSDDVICIEVTDRKSGVRFLDVTMSLDAFARCVTGFGAQPADGELRAENVGKTRQVKEEWVPCGGGLFDKNRLRSADALAPFEVDGWMGRASDYGNGHRYDGKREAYRVTFIRFVDEAAQ